MPAQYVVAPLLAALGSIVVTLSLRRAPRAQRLVSVAGAAVYAVAVGALAWRVVLAPSAPGVAAYQVGGWSAPFGISLVADGLSAFMLVVAAVVGLFSLAFSVVVVDTENQRVFYHPLFHCLLLGVAGAFLTGDLFNLFVWFEVLLMASYVFVAFYGGPEHTAGAFRYLVLNVIGSVLLLLAIGGLYASVGTLNMADMARRLAAPEVYSVDPRPVVGLSGLLLSAFALKAGLVPFQFWAPAAYRAAPAPVAAMLAGVTKKVGIYAIVRLYFTVFAGATVTTSLPGSAGNTLLSFLAPVLFLMGLASVLAGGLGAVSRETIDGMLAYSSISQIGFVAVPIAVAAAAAGELRRVALVAALVFALHHAFAKGVLFLAAAVVRSATGTYRFEELGGLSGRSPVLAGAFLVGSLSLVGIPPLAGFFGKFLVFEAAARQFEAGGSGSAVVLVGLLVGSVLSVLYTTRAWTLGFWGVCPPRVEDATFDRAQVAIVAAFATVVIAVGVGFEPVATFADAAADAALGREAYVEIVDPAGGASG